MFSEPNCKFESSLANFYDPTDPKVEHMGVFEPGFWTRTGTWAYHLHPSKLYRRLADPAGFKQMGKWRGRDDVPIQEQVQSIGILSYSRSVPEFMATVLAGVNLSGDPLQVAKVATDEFEPKEPPEDTTPVTVELVPVGNSGVRGKITLRPLRVPASRPRQLVPLLRHHQSHGDRRDGRDRHRLPFQRRTHGGSRASVPSSTSGTASTS